MGSDQEISLTSTQVVDVLRLATCIPMTSSEGVDAVSSPRSIRAYSVSRAVPVVVANALCLARPVRLPDTGCPPEGHLIPRGSEINE